MADPLASIIIPAFNKAQLTVRTVESVLAQTYPKVEVIVVDDGSTDDTAARMALFGSRIRYAHQPNGGACKARNTGIAMAQGEFLGFLDCDDVYLPMKVERCVNFLRGHPAAGFVHTAAQFIDRQGKVLGAYSHRHSRRTGWIADLLIRGNYICNSTVIARRSCFEKAGNFDESIFMPADWDMWLRLAEQDEAGYIDEPLTQYRVSDNYIYRRLAQAQTEEERVIRKYFERRPQLAGMARRQVLSDFHLRYAQAFFVQDDRLRCRSEFLAAGRANPLSIRAWAMMGYYFLARRSLKAELSRRILRGGD